ncbi:MAG: hypothetical protein CM1200mP14_16150 [Gammaproteobacteria bacterium]|nr:MAG: hypothetical protein CM1200mP14_16150 [Gammaproteobacteria bacterium]
MSEKDVDLRLVDLIGKVVGGIRLTATESEAAFDRFMDGSASEIEMAGLLAALRTKGAKHTEIAGGVRALRKAMVPVFSSEPQRLVDTAGTGGGEVTTFNISTAAALVAAGAGVPIAKHGNRSFTSRSGSADVLEALGVDIDLTPERMGEILEEVGIVFMFAPLLHPAMRHVAPVRRALGITTIMKSSDLSPIQRELSGRSWAFLTRAYVVSWLEDCKKLDIYELSSCMVIQAWTKSVHQVLRTFRSCQILEYLNTM